MFFFFFQGVTQCGCADGLECRVTKEFSVLGQKIQLRQCMETGLDTAVEKLENNEEEEPGKRERRFLVDVSRKKLFVQNHVIK